MNMQKSALHNIWLDLGARFTEWHGCRVVDHFGDPEAEYWAVRRRAGLFDMSALGKFKVRGPDAARFLDKVLTRKASSGVNGQALYSPICNQDGGFVGECILFCIGTDDFLLSILGSNGSSDDKVWLAGHATGMNVKIEDVTDAWFCLAVAGPRSRDILRPLVETSPAPSGTRLADLEYYSFEVTHLAGIEVLLSRTGHTGELGYEMFAPREHAAAIWKALARSGQGHGLMPCGFGAWEILRIESGLWLHGCDTDGATTPYHLGLDWAVDLEKEDFVGKAALEQLQRRGVEERLVGLELAGIRSATSGAKVYAKVHDDTGKVGAVTSACFCPGLQKSIALARVATRAAYLGSCLSVDLDSGLTGEAWVVRLPFSDPHKRRPRGIRFKAPRPRSTTGIFRKLGVKKIINGVGTWAISGGSLMAPEVVQAMREASQCFVDITELQARCGERVAELTGAEAAYICGGASAGLALSAAACMVGTDVEKIEQLPYVEGVQKYEIIMFRSHRNGFDQGTRQAGARLREIGYSWEALPRQLEGVISQHTAAIHYDYFGYMMAPFSSMRLEQVLQIAHGHGVPVMLDIAGELPPPENLTKFPEMGVDLTIFSGGKGLMGPQGAGLILGRKDLIEAVTLNGNPYYGIGRSMKADKETMVGMVRAVELYVNRDHDADRQRWSAQARYLVEHLSGIPGFQVSSEPETPHGRPVPQVYISWDQRAMGMQVEQAINYLTSLDPAVWVSKHLHHLRINPHMMPAGDEVIMAEMVREFMEGAGTGKILLPPLEDEWLPLSATAPHMA